ncbi:MAG: S8 family serine peptidase [Winogradskyella sp.]|uniref:S8 family serine peptidase n=1 Tax=Winogradskyella sp. TaxID=1883156 RepID=UPI00184B9622|nr:S8 family serine peptidase [Winogradskyella sp.]
MSRKVTILVLLLSTINSFAQVEDAWVYLTDKPNEASALANPISILTQKAIDRKQHHNIPIDSRDIPVHEPYLSNLKSQNGITVLAKSKWFNAVHIRGTEADINSLATLSYIDRIDFADNNLDSPLRQEANNDKHRIEDEAINFTYGSSQNQVEMINVHTLHLDDFTGEGITIAVMDSGFPNVNTMGAFQRLRDNGDLLNGYDFVNRTANVYVSNFSSHGTRVLSDMAGYVQDQFVGTAPDASYYLFLTEDVTSENPVEESYWVEAAERADSLGVDIINTSLGYRVFDNSNYNYTPSDMNGQVAYISKGASIAVEKGILVVVSAGNAGATSWQTVGAPGDSPAVLSVGAVDENGDYVAFSSQGGAAQVGYQKPDVVARGGGAFVIDANNTIIQNNGTSFSSPILCGGIASLWQALPEFTAIEVMDFVRQSASQYTSPDDFLGFGIPDLGLARNMALGIEEFALETIKIYPNPVTDILNFDFSLANGFVEIIILNALGQQLLEKKLYDGTESINVSDFTSGLYLIKATIDKNTKSFKFIKE